jgi:hypothetical protein
MPLEYPVDHHGGPAQTSLPHLAGTAELDCLGLGSTGYYTDSVVAGSSPKRGVERGLGSKRDRHPSNTIQPRQLRCARASAARRSASLSESWAITRSLITRSTGARSASQGATTGSAQSPHEPASRPGGRRRRRDLPARWVIHTVGSVYAGLEDRSELLASCYRTTRRQDPNKCVGVVNAALHDLLDQQQGIACRWQDADSVLSSPLGGPRPAHPAVN